MLFGSQSRLLASHRGWDPGALWIARGLARRLRAPLVAATTTRLLVDLNRSPRNPAIFSELTRGLTSEERDRLITTVHGPHWRRIREALDRAPRPVVHLAVHSFAPRLDGRIRAFDLGLLYDPARARERAFAACLRARLAAADGSLRVRRNAPYRGNSDGLTTALRRERPAAGYLGLELELNQALLRSAAGRARLLGLLASCLRASLDERDGWDSEAG
jgi:predicted N-formylglutamate amidohydrolase